MVLLTVTLLCLFSTVVVASDIYLCIGEMATGFSFGKNREWKVSLFAEHDKYIVKKDTVSQKKWGVYAFGGPDTPLAECHDGFDKAGSLICEEGTGVEFRMNNKNGRFLYFYYLGYWTDNRGDKLFVEGENTPYIQIGKCVPK
jgi:hypothetical protein